MTLQEFADKFTESSTIKYKAYMWISKKRKFETIGLGTLDEVSERSANKEIIKITYEHEPKNRKDIYLDIEVKE